MSDQFLKKFMIKRNTLIIVYIKTHTQYWSKFFKQTSVNIIRNKSCCPKPAASHQHRGLGWSLGDRSCWMRRRRRVLLLSLFANQNHVSSHWNHLKIVKGWKGKGRVNSWYKDSVYIQLIINPIEFNIIQIRHLIPACVHILCTYTWEHIVPHLHSPFLVAGYWNTR